MHKRGLRRHAVSLSVRLSVFPVLSRSYILSKRIKTYLQFFSPSGSHTILVFPYRKSWQYSDGDTQTGASNVGGLGKNHYFRPVSRFIACWEYCDGYVVLSTRCRRTEASDTRRSLLTAGDDDELFVTRSLHVMPKTTEQLRSDKSEAQVTNNRRRFVQSKLTTDTKYRAASLRQQSYLYFHCNSDSAVCVFMFPQKRRNRAERTISKIQATRYRRK